jgi:hypothetical protein
MPVLVAELSEAHTVFGRLNARIVVWNPTRGLNVFHQLSNRVKSFRRDLILKRGGQCFRKNKLHIFREPFTVQIFRTDR